MAGGLRIGAGNEDQVSGTRPPDRLGEAVVMVAGFVIGSGIIPPVIARFIAVDAGVFRRIKDCNFDVFRDGWSDLRWCLFISKGNHFVGDTVSFEAVLADFDALRDGDYAATFAIVDSTIAANFILRRSPSSSFNSCSVFLSIVYFVYDV